MSGSAWATWADDVGDVLAPFARRAAELMRQYGSEADRFLRVAERELEEGQPAPAAPVASPSWQRVHELQEAIQAHLVAVELSELPLLTELQRLALARMVATTRGRLRELAGMEEGS